MASQRSTKGKKGASRAKVPAKAKTKAKSKAPTRAKAKPKAKASTKARSKPAGGPPITLLVGTRKGLFVYRSDRARTTWKLDGVHFFGQIVHHAVLDPRDGKTLLVAARTGHLGPTLQRSLDGGRTWVESRQPPAFPKAPEGQKGRVVGHNFWLTPGHASEPGVWYAGTSPQGLFRSEDAGETWTGVKGFNEHPDRKAWCGGDQDGTPDGPMLHSIVIDPRDKRHMYLSMSGGGTFESLDQGADWKPFNKGVLADFMPEDKYPAFGQDPHCMVLHPAAPDRLYQQNHCGIYRCDRPSDTWVRIGDNMPREVGDIGFPIVVHPRDPDTAWVVPMDGSTVWPRTSVGGRPAVFMTRDAGKSWKRQDKGLPARNAWHTVKRQAFDADGRDPVGLYFGTTSGEIWASIDQGSSWKQIAGHLPHVYSVVVAKTG